MAVTMQLDLFLVDEPAQSLAPICFHILAEIGALGEYLEKGQRWSETVGGLNVPYALPYGLVLFESMSVAFWHCNRLFINRHSPHFSSIELKMWIGIRVGPHSREVPIVKQKLGGFRGDHFRSGNFGHFASFRQIVYSS